MTLAVRLSWRPTHLRPRRELCQMLCRSTRAASSSRCLVNQVLPTPELAGVVRVWRVTPRHHVMSAVSADPITHPRLVADQLLALMIQAAAFSAIMSVGELVLPLVMVGMAPASTTRKPATPRTRI